MFGIFRPLYDAFPKCFQNAFFQTADLNLGHSQTIGRLFLRLIFIITQLDQLLLFRIQRCDSTGQIQALFDVHLRLRLGKRISQTELLFAV